jgi:hypothetical protein
LLRNCAINSSRSSESTPTIEEAVFSVGAAPRLYNEDLTQVESELSCVPELAVAA